MDNRVLLAQLSLKVRQHFEIKELMQKNTRALVYMSVNHRNERNRLKTNKAPGTEIMDLLARQTGEITDLRLNNSTNLAKLDERQKIETNESNSHNLNNEEREEQ